MGLMKKARIYAASVLISAGWKLMPESGKVNIIAAVNGAYECVMRKRADGAHDAAAGGGGATVCDVDGAEYRLEYGRAVKDRNNPTQG